MSDGKKNIETKRDGIGFCKMMAVFILFIEVKLRLRRTKMLIKFK
jgi:hypothetical protein